MKTTSDKIAMILEEIRTGVKAHDISAKKSISANDVVRLMLRIENDSPAAGGRSGNSAIITNSQDQADIIPEKRFTFDNHELKRCKDRNNEVWAVNYFRPLTSYFRLFSPIVIWVKRKIRKMLFFLISPIVEDQNNANCSFTSSINAIYNNELVTEEFVHYMEECIRRYNNRIGQLESVCNDIENKLSSSDNKCEERIDKALKALNDKFEKNFTHQKATIQQLTERCELKIDQMETRLTDPMHNLKKDVFSLRGKMKEYMEPKLEQMMEKSNHLEERLADMVSSFQEDAAAMNKKLEIVTLKNRMLIDKLSYIESTCKNYEHLQATISSKFDELQRRHDLFEDILQNNRIKYALEESKRMEIQSQLSCLEEIVRFGRGENGVKRVK